MKRTKFKVLTLVILLVVLTTTSVFAGRWYTESFNSQSTFTFLTEELDHTRGMPAISFNVSSEPSFRRITVELLQWDYVPRPISQGGGWQFVPVQEKTVSVYANSSKFVDMHWTDGLITGPIRYRISVDRGGASTFTGTVQYYGD